MERITYRISLDTQKNGVQKILQGFNVGDQVARRIEIALTAGGNTIDLPDTGVTALMYVTVDGIASVNAVTIEDGRAFYDVDANDTATAGMVMMNLKVLDTTTGMVLYAPQFQLEVWENGIGSSSAATSPTFTALESALAQAQLYSQRTIKSVYIDDDTDIFTVEYMDGSVYTSSVIADAVEKIGDVEQYVQRAETAAQNAFESETTARTSEINAVASATQAALSETYAEQYKDTALTAAQSATASENAAASSENKALMSEQAAAGYAADAKTNATIAQTSEANALTSELNAYAYEQNARTSAANALVSEQAATTAASNVQSYATAAESYAVGGTGTRTNEDNDNAKYYKEICQQIAGGMQGGLIPMGTVAFANLPTVNVGTGWLYNISDAFTSDNRFKDGAGIYYEAGADVYRTADGYWDVLSYGVPKVNGKVGNDIVLDAGDLLMSNYVKATTAAEIQPTDTILEAFGKMEKAHDDIDLVKANKTNTTAGTYRSVTVNMDGLVTGGTNPTTLAGYGITDANINTSTKEITLGANKITPLTVQSIEDSLTNTSTQKALAARRGKELNDKITAIVTAVSETIPASAWQADTTYTDHPYKAIVSTTAFAKLSGVYECVCLADATRLNTDEEQSELDEKIKKGFEVSATDIVAYATEPMTFDFVVIAKGV